MRKDNMEQRSAEELTTEELEHVSAAGGQGVPPPTNYQVWGTTQGPKTQTDCPGGPRDD